MVSHLIYLKTKINRRVNIFFAEGIEHINENSDPLNPVLPYILKKG